MIQAQADIVVIGGGIAGLSIAYVAAQNGIRSIVLDKGILEGTATHAATGLLAPRADYLLKDEELVRATAYECARLRQIFYPQIIKPRLFLIPIGPKSPYGIKSFEALLDLYDQKTKSRLYQLPSKSFTIDAKALEKIEPNLRKRFFLGAVAFWEWTVDPDLFVRKLRNESVMFTPYVQRFIVQDVNFKTGNSIIQEVSARTKSDNQVRIYNTRTPLLVVNAAGPWLNDINEKLNINIPLRYKLGVQIAVLGRYLQSGIVTFGEEGEGLICLQHSDYLQVGPTNTTFFGHPNNVEVTDRDISYLVKALNNILEPGPDLIARVLKSGLRVKPYFIDTDRPVIWPHQNVGVDNFYTVHPGKMVLGLKMAEEFLERARNDGWLRVAPSRFMVKTHSLDGTKTTFNQAKLVWLRIRSVFLIGIHFLKFFAELKNP